MKEILIFFTIFISVFIILILDGFLLDSTSLNVLFSFGVYHLSFNILNILKFNKWKGSSSKEARKSHHSHKVRLRARNFLSLSLSLSLYLSLSPSLSFLSLRPSLSSIAPDKSIWQNLVSARRWCKCLLVSHNRQVHLTVSMRESRLFVRSCVDGSALHVFFVLNNLWDKR